MKKLFALLVLAVLICAPSMAQAAYPTKPITIILASGPGGLLDNSTRVFANFLSKELGQPVIVSNVTGGQGNVGINQFLGEKHDGYTLLVVNSPQVTYNALMPKSRFKYEDFRPLCIIGENRMGYVTQPDRPWKDMRDAIAWAKKEKQPLVVGVLSEEDKAIALSLGEAQGVKISPVPQASGGACLTAAIGGHVDIAILGLILVDNVKAGKIKLLASQSTKRFAKIPEVSTLIEQGYNYYADVCFPVLGHKDIPEDVAMTIQKAYAKFGNSAEYKEQIYDRLNLELSDPSVGAAKKFMDAINESSKRNYKP